MPAAHRCYGTSRVAPPCGAWVCIFGPVLEACHKPKEGRRPKAERHMDGYRIAATEAGRIALLCEKYGLPGPETSSEGGANQAEAGLAEGI